MNPLILYILILIVSILALKYSSKWLVESLERVAHFLGWKEFVVAFFTMAVAATIPNVFLAISSIIHNRPELSLADIMGGNLVDLTLAVALATLASVKGLSLKSRTVQGSSIFVLIVSVLPLILMQDQVLSRTDGVVLILTFFVYTIWLFRKKERFEKNYEQKEKIGLAKALKDLLIFFGTIAILVLAAEGIVRSAIFFAGFFNISLVLIGIFLVAIGNAIPETIFAIKAAKKGDDWMVVGNLMGSIILPATLVLGFVALISPIEMVDFTPFTIARIFLFIAAILFFFFIRTEERINKIEAIILIILYVLFLVLEIIF